MGELWGKSYSGLLLLAAAALVMLCGGWASDATPYEELVRQPRNGLVAMELPEPEELTRPASIRLVFTGDNLLGARMPQLISKYGEDWPYSQVAQYLLAGDMTFGNLESPITSYATKTPGKSWESIHAGRNFIFKAPPEYSGRILSRAGFDVVSLANNHAMDYCAQGLSDTFAALSTAGITYVGAGQHAEGAWQAQVVEANGWRVGVLGATMIVPAASRAGDASPGLAAHGKQYSEFLGSRIRALRQQADVVVVTFHWGYESQRIHAAYQQSIGRACIDEGADIVIGHHPHVLQGVEFYHGGVIAYSLGNFLFTGGSPLVESAVLTITAGAGGVERVECVPCWVRGGQPQPSRDGNLISRINGILKHTGTVLRESGEWYEIVPR